MVHVVEQFLRKIKSSKILMLLILIIALVCIGNEVQAVDKYGELYRLNNECVTRILPRTTLKDFRNNLEIFGEDITVTNADGEVLTDDNFVGSGMTFKRGDNTYKLSVIGDLDGNGRITITDLIKMRLHSSNIKKVDADYEQAVDLDGNEKYTITDLTQLNLSLIGIKDIIAPNSFVPTAIATTNSITITGETIDENSGIAEYYFKIDNGEWVQNEDKQAKTYTFANLDSNKTYILRMKAKDNAGNEIITEPIQVEMAKGKLQITPSTEEWTNKDITITIEANSNIVGAKKQISLDGGITYQTYTAPIKIDKNTIIFARLLDNNNDILEEKSLKIDWIDKLAPKEFEVTTQMDAQTNAIIVNAEATDAEATSENASSGIKEYRYILKNGVWAWEQDSHIFENLINGVEYTIEVVAVDNAGNKTSVELPVEMNINCILTYEVNGGELDKTRDIVKYGESVTLPTPTKAGYIFKGWYTDSEFANKAESPYVATENVTLYAKWEEATDTPYTVIHEQMNLDGTTYTTVDTENAQGETGEQVTPEVKTYEGFTSPQVQTVTIAADGSTVVTYKYTRNKYKFTLGSAEGVSTSGSTASGSYYYGETIILKAKVNDGYSWSKWESSNTSLVADTTIANTTFTMPAGALTMTPKATIVEYTISYDLAGGTATTVNVTSYTVKSEMITLYNPARVGYTFTGWTGSNGDTASTTVTITEGTTGNKEYTANWEATPYTITYNLGGGTVTGNPTSYTIESSAITLNNPTKEGYTFKGWTGSNGNTASKTVTIAKGSTGDKTYTANWEKIKYTLTYDANKGNVSPTSTTAYAGESITMPIPTISYTISFETNGGNEISPISATHNFTGWYTTPGGGTKREYTIMPAYNETLYAHWSVIFVQLPIPQRDGYVFDGWYEDSELTELVEGTHIFRYSDVKFYAKWKESGVYAKLYTDGTLALSATDEQIEGKTLVENGDFGNIKNKSYGNMSTSYTPWYNNKEEITTIEIVDKITPLSTSGWFYGLSNVTEVVNISNLDTKNVTSMAVMFQGCNSLTSLDVSGFNTSKVTSMNAMFWNCYKLTSLDVSGFDTSNVTNMNGMFWDCDKLTSLDVSGFDTSNVTLMGNMFNGCSALTSLDVSEFDTSNVTDMSRMFNECSSLTSLNVSGFNTSNVTDMNAMFNDCGSLTSLEVSGFNTSNVTDMSGMFNSCGSLTSLEVSGFNTSNVTDMSRMFAYCSSLTSLDVSDFDTSKVTDMSAMFYNCNNLETLAISDFETSNVTDMSSMFYNCGNLTTLDLSGFNTGNVTDMHRMFGFCKSLTSLNLSVFNTSNVTDMCEMFTNCESLITLTVSSFDTSNVTDMSFMFFGCTNITRLLLSFKTSNVTDMTRMFGYCSNLTQLLVVGTYWDTSSATTDGMFDNCGVSEVTKI